MKIELDDYDVIAVECIGKALVEMAAQKRAYYESQRLATQAATPAPESRDIAPESRDIAPTEDGEAEAPRKRGRPKGSTNKPKEPEAVPEPVPTESATVAAAPVESATVAAAPVESAPVAAVVEKAQFATAVDAAKAYHAKFGVMGLATLLRERYQGTRAGELTGDDAAAFIHDVSTALEFGVPLGEDDAR